MVIVLVDLPVILTMYHFFFFLLLFKFHLIVKIINNGNRTAEMCPGFQIRGSSGPHLEKFGGPLLNFGGPANL